MARSIDPRLLDLNPAFLLDRKIAPIDVAGGRLRLGMRDRGDLASIAAMRYAARIEVDPVPIDDDEWSAWHAALTAAGPAPPLASLRSGRDTSIAELAGTSAAPDGNGRRRASATIYLGLDSIDVQIRPSGYTGHGGYTGQEYAASFAHDDDIAWDALGRRLGLGGRINVVVQAPASCKVALRQAPADARALRRALASLSPLQLDRVVWSSPIVAPGDDAPSVSLVHAEWLRARIAVIVQSLSPAELTVSDHAGRLFAAKPPGHRGAAIARAAAAPAIAATMLAIILAIGVTWDRPLPAPLPPALSTAAKPAIDRAAIVPAPMRVSPTPPLAAEPATNADFTLIGVAGRLPADAVALVRPAWGKTVTLRVGDSLLGWTLASIAADRVTLKRGSATQELVLEPTPDG